MQGYVYSRREELDAPCVLFQDYNGHWAPLNDLYYSTSSQVLVSRHPESAIEEVVSHYCPQCLNKYNAEEDVQKYANRCATCLQCPCCASLLTAGPVEGSGEGECCLVCTNCSWTSAACGIIGKTEQELGALVLTRENDNKATASGAFASLLTALTLSTTSQHTSSSANTSAKVPRQRQTWDLNALDEMQQKKTSQSLSCNPQDESSLYTYLKTNNISAQAAEKQAGDMTSLLSCTDSSTLNNFAQRRTGEYTCSGNCVSIHDLLPQRMYLRTKKMLRCRRDVLAGKMSILIQPKTFPLEGDSSHKLHQGKWFLKDASACHHVPRVILTQLPTFAGPDSSGMRTGHLHFEIINSKDVDVLVAVAAPCPADNATSSGVGDSEIKKEVVGEDDDVRVEDISLDDKKGILEDYEQEERHPPFAFQRGGHRSHILTVQSTPPSCMVLRGYEDELLRDDSDLPAVPDLAREEQSWSVLMDNHVAKVCVPVSYMETVNSQSSSSMHHRYAEASFSMLVADSKLKADVQVGGSGTPEVSAEEMQAFRKEGVKVLFRVAFQL